MLSLENLCRETIRIVEPVAEFIGREVGRVLSDAIEEKERNSLVSYVDRQAEQRLVEALGRLLPGSTFLTEEDTIENRESDQQWIIDPLDGTTNFLHQLPCFSVSVALRRAGRLAVGVVYEINRRECFYAWRNGGAYLNGRPVHVSRTPELAAGLLATGFPYMDFAQLTAYLDILRHFMQHSRGIRRFGSAAVDLAYVACGRFDAFFEYNLNPWDVAGGALIVEEAGGRVTDFRGDGDFLHGREIIAANPRVYEAVREVIGQYWNDGTETAFYPGKP